MKTKIVVETNVGKLIHNHWLSVYDEAGNVILVSDEDSDSVKFTALTLEISEKAVIAIEQALEFMAETIIHELEKDLVDIWNKKEGG